ncbi:predicted protein [Chaetoceros tenuissimus]|uniref:Protein kinase domain-containing protein n=1 Tax=Chaetoceros tenuissimus TaxID=426638 RepID=A0AAD3CYS7_9STRA|nr:predicted protein [Chaetoceros tenuissimus]
MLRRKRETPPVPDEVGTRDAKKDAGVHWGERKLNNNIQVTSHWCQFYSKSNVILVLTVVMMALYASTVHVINDENAVRTREEKDSKSRLRISSPCIPNEHGTVEDIDMNTSGGKNHDGSNRNKSDGRTMLQNDPNDISWMDHVQLGEWIGSGGWSDAFEAIIDNEYNPTNKSYIIKFTGDTEADGDVDYAKSAITAVEALKRLSPHPSIPENLFFVPSTPNPFFNRYQLPKQPMSVDESTGTKEMQGNKILNSTNMAIQVCERVTRTHNHKYGKMPGGKMRCFLHRLFDFLDYAHSKNIMIIDIALQNMILQDGVLKFIDWSDAAIFEGRNERKRRLSKNITLPYAICSAGQCTDGVKRDYDNVHEHDVSSLGPRISRMLEDYDDIDAGYDEEQKFYKKHGKYFINHRDRHLIQNMTNMMSEERPTLRWLLDNHDYFSEDTSNCTLVW